MSLVLDCEHAVGPSLLALLTQKILMWGPTVGVIGLLGLESGGSLERELRF